MLLVPASGCLGRFCFLRFCCCICPAPLLVLLLLLGCLLLPLVCLLLLVLVCLLLLLGCLLLLLLACLPVCSSLRPPLTLAWALLLPALPGWVLTAHTTATARAQGWECGLTSARHECCSRPAWHVTPTLLSGGRDTLLLLPSMVKDGNSVDLA